MPRTKKDAAEELSQELRVVIEYVTDEELAKLFAFLKKMEVVRDLVREEILSRHEDGSVIPGLSVRPMPARYEWLDEKDMNAALRVREETGLDLDEIAPRTMITPAALKDLLNAQRKKKKLPLLNTAYMAELFPGAVGQKPETLAVYVQDTTWVRDGHGEFISEEDEE